MSEYTYDIDKYTIGVDENGEDGIGMTVAKIENGGLHFLGNYYGENARCLDLLIKENQEIKEKLEQYQEEVCILDMRTGENIKYKTQQQEFIKFLEDNYESTQDIWYIKILQKYKEIIGDDK